MAEEQGAARNFSLASLMLKLVAVLAATIVGLALSLAVFGGDAEDPRGGAFTLIDTSGETVTETVLEGRISLVYFGFTHCPDICPTELANMVAARAASRERGIEPQIVFIAVDPRRDTPDFLRGYLDAFGDDLIGLTGPEAALSAAAKAYGARFYAEPPEDESNPLNYQVVHTTLVYAVGPDGRVFWRFPGVTPPDVIAKRLAEFQAS